jgi:hypothetical protein
MRLAFSSRPINQPVADATAAPITLILNWRAPATR